MSAAELSITPTIQEHPLLPDEAANGADELMKMAIKRFGQKRRQGTVVATLRRTDKTGALKNELVVTSSTLEGSGLTLMTRRFRLIVTPRQEVQGRIRPAVIDFMPHLGQPSCTSQESLSQARAVLSKALPRR
ncbi:MAG: hypothetical protein HY344_02895 [Candidatus Levybacteria bacterium]|nr:hypothetical protein [Candidatus Levybacteria bacterium]